jgi:hypothetical protein
VEGGVLCVISSTKCFHDALFASRIMLFYMTANLVSHSEFNTKIEGIKNKMMSIKSGFMREELTWN